MPTGDYSTLEVESLGKLYSRSTAATRYREAIAFGRALLKRPPKTPNKLSKGEFWGLQNINFTLERGEALGIIGHNGAGKTTLLRILAGQILPDKGEARIFGSHASMIDLQAGFNPKTSGRANIFLRGAMLGRTRREIESSLDETIAFSELGDAIEAPFGTYSSGMKMRLAFSVMMASEPDIMFIDEVLAVGDFRFRQKCLAKIRSVRERVAFVLVSHSMSDVKAFCSKVIVLNEGEIVFIGDPEEAVDVYENMKYPEKLSAEAKQAAILKPQFSNDDALSEIDHFWCNAKGERIESIAPDDDLYFMLRFTPKHTPRNLIIGVPVWTEAGNYVTGFSSQLQTEKVTAKAGELAQYILHVPSHGLNSGDYVSNLSLNDGPEFLYRRSNDILTVDQTPQRRWGVVTMPHSWQPLSAKD